MNKLCCLIILFFTCGVCSGQNLVPNPSFEDKLGCPAGVQPTIDLATYWSSYGGTSDYFNSCANGVNVNWGVPNNFPGYQNAYNGVAYGGLITWGVSPNVREYMGVQLTSQLVIGTKYYVSCYISNADSATFTGNYNSSSNNFGIKFSTVQYSDTSNSPPLNNFSQIRADSIVTDKINWTRIAGSFIADSAYQYLMLGNFYDDQHTLGDSVPPFSSFYAYYYIDAVVVSTDSLTTVGVNVIRGEDELILFPNPFTDKINIKVKRNELVEVNLFDVTSRKIFNESFVNSTSINTEQLAKGIYLYEVRNKNGVIKKGKIVKD